MREKSLVRTRSDLGSGKIYMQNIFVQNFIGFFRIQSHNIIFLTLVRRDI